MDFIERWFHISPDGGNGMAEVLIVTAIIVTVVSLIAALPLFSEEFRGIFGAAWEARK